MEPMVASTGRLDSRSSTARDRGDPHGAIGTVHHRILAASAGLEQASILLEAGVEDVFHAFDIVTTGRGLLVEAIEIDPGPESVFKLLGGEIGRLDGLGTLDDQRPGDDRHAHQGHR